MRNGTVSVCCLGLGFKSVVPGNVRSTSYLGFKEIKFVVSRHFLTSGHAEDHMILIPLERLHTSRDSIRKAREAFLIHRGKTMEPAGVNRIDEM